MEIVFNNRRLLALYETGSGARLKLEKKVVHSFIEAVAVLEAAKDIHDLWALPSLRFEKLQGRKNGYSVRLDRKWRLEMSIEWRNEEMTVGIIGIEDISSHYGG